MQLPYCFLSEAQFSAAGNSPRPVTASPSVLWRHILAASRRIDALRGDVLFERRTETFRSGGLQFDGDDLQWWDVGMDFGSIVSLTAAGRAVAEAEIQTRYQQVGIPTTYAAPLVMTAEWGPGRRGKSVGGEALAADAAYVAAPNPAPDWFEAGGVFVVESEVVLIGEPADGRFRLWRDNPVEHNAADWTPIESPPHLKEACVTMARRLARLATTPSKSPEWKSLESGYEELINERSGRA